MSGVLKEGEIGTQTHTHREVHVKTQREDGNLQAKE